MKSILDQLYYGKYDLIGAPPSKEYKECSKKLRLFWEQIGEHFGNTYCTEFSNALAQQESVQERQMFREGFLLGGRLMLELLTDSDTALL